MYWVLLETLQYRNRLWFGPFADINVAHDKAIETYSQAIVPKEFHTEGLNAVNDLQRAGCRVWYGTRTRNVGRPGYTMNGMEIFLEDLPTEFPVKDALTIAFEAEEDEEPLNEECYGPMLDDWCDDETCNGVGEWHEANPLPADTGPSEIYPYAPSAFNNDEVAPYTHSLMGLTMAEMLQWAADQDLPIDDIASDEFVRANFLLGEHFGDWDGVDSYHRPEIREDMGKVFVVDDAIAWVNDNCGVGFQWNFDYGDAQEPWREYEEFGTEEDVIIKRRLVGHDVRVELWAQVGSTFGIAGNGYCGRTYYSPFFLGTDGFNAYTFLGRRNVRQIYNSLYTKRFGPTDYFVFRNWWAGKKMLTDFHLNGGGQSTAQWCIGVKFIITPVFRTGHGFPECDIEENGLTQVVTVIGYSPRPVPPDNPVTGNPFNPRNYQPSTGTETHDPAPWTAGLFVEPDGEAPAPAAPSEDTEGDQRQLLGWSGNGLSLTELLILNPSWAVQGFIQNYKPFKRIPGYKRMVEFIKKITGGKAQFESLGTDPETGFEYYPVPVIIGADESGFAVYGPAVYGNKEVKGFADGDGRSN